MEQAFSWLLIMVSRSQPFIDFQSFNRYLAATITGMLLILKNFDVEDERWSKKHAE